MHKNVPHWNPPPMIAYLMQSRQTMHLSSHKKSHIIKNISALYPLASQRCVVQSLPRPGDRDNTQPEIYTY